MADTGLVFAVDVLVIPSAFLHNDFKYMYGRVL